jgi:hypothetical protein
VRVVLLGDLVYPNGLPDSLDQDYSQAKRDLTTLLKTFIDYPGKVFFLPGNHDWSRGSRQGWESVKNEEKFIEHYLNRGNVYLPDQGCPGPVEISLTDDITLIIFDSQWWFQENVKPGSDDGCDYTEDNELFMQIDDALRRNQNKKVIVFHDPQMHLKEETDYLNRIESGSDKYNLSDFRNRQARFGTLAIYTNVIDKEPVEIYHYFKSRQSIETMFDAMKNILRADRSYMQNDDALSGWLFISYLALQWYYHIYNL